jgi:murein DD-endopeptidase MepM/ murein hydrolase activator NlpD
MEKVGKPVLLFPVISVAMVIIAFLLVNVLKSEPEAIPEQQVKYIEPYAIQSSTEPQIYFYPENPYPGDFLVIEAAPVEMNNAVTIEFSFPGTISDYYRFGENLFIVAGISYDTEPGLYTVTIKNTADEDSNILVIADLNIGAKDFHVSRFSVPPSTTVGWTAERLAEDREKTRIARETTEPYPLWLQKFVLPTEGRISSEYAAIRYINDNPPRRHNGIDIAADEGVPVVAANRGIVRLAEFLLSGGNTVIIDHGLNLSSTYMHLETLTISAGQTVERGEQIGTVGMTGYASGPHLHWELNIGHAPVNPMQLLDNDLLWIPPAYVREMLN